jgi:hypothetical protein
MPDPTETALNAAQVLFSLNPAHAPQASHLWRAQEQILGDAGRLSSAWVERRQAAMRAAMDLASQLAGEGMRDPAAATRAMAEWQRGSVARLAEDARDATAFIARCAGCLTANEIEAAQETVQEAGRALDERHATPV